MIMMMMTKTQICQITMMRLSKKLKFSLNAAKLLIIYTKVNKCLVSLETQVLNVDLLFIRLMNDFITLTHSRLKCGGQ